MAAHTSLPAVAAATGTIAVVAAETVFAGFGLIHLDIPAFQLGVVELCDGLGRLVRTRHLNKAKALRLAGKFVRDDHRALHLSGLRKQVFQVAIGDRVGQIPIYNLLGIMPSVLIWPGSSRTENPG